MLNNQLTATDFTPVNRRLLTLSHRSDGETTQMGHFTPDDWNLHFLLDTIFLPTCNQGIAGQTITIPSSLENCVRLQ